MRRAEDIRFRTVPGGRIQWTGFKDDIGNDIYEDDIVSWGNDDKLYHVIFWEGMFYASVETMNEGVYGGYPLYALLEDYGKDFRCHVLGNLNTDPNLRAAIKSSKYFDSKK